MATNPSVEAPRRTKDADFIPMGMSEQMLAVPELPGYRLFWAIDRPGRIGRLQAKGWEFVKQSEMDIPNFKTISGSVAESGNTDLGDNISVHGDVSEAGQSTRLYLMKIKEDLWQATVEAPREARSEQIAQAMKGRRIGAEREAQGDAARRYVPRVGGKTTLFDKKR